ncbi:juvenile hormone epoxide hydrolase-like [Pectinophora gossypiella]|uniref:juvenile hormone epoxide hydrolase-like n=1 Tax=Pectinophora gossypiella TaxID=13191 RepID=UPI00214F0796|nr:juvenile hormone epoxide hydrolase-like [Pectinophora gossypiella]XP_049872239.1 juvenile hormone epoxide hydrolase-like [Pectinophora gossypiella]XP_049872240.1 juvenile hormone epoxide hydrolase-like [Pectinophora gossypiella]
MFKLLSGIIAAVAIVTGVFIPIYLQRVPDMPNLDHQRWWGVGKKTEDEDTSIRPFKIEFDDAMIEDLRRRLRNKRPLTMPLQGIQSQYGINTIYLEKKLKYWMEEYDFKKRAELLNAYPHFKTKIQGLDIHFIRVKPHVTDKKALPLLMMHGWPSSSKEFDKVIPLLTTPRKGYDFVFEVVAVDLPGFGFSEGTTKPGLNPAQMAIMMRNLMRRIGFSKFYIQAGDWGSQVGSHMATIFPDEILGFHTNMPTSSRPLTYVKILVGSWFPFMFKHAERIYPLRRSISVLVRESGYFHIQATKPDTIGVALTDSPAGLAGYLMEKLGMCSNRNQLDTPHSGLDNLDIDDVLDIITIVWANNCIVTASRIYAEGVTGIWPEVKILHNIPTPVPTAAINFLHEVTYQPDWMLKDKYPNLVRSTTLDFGGHFAALQTPEVFANDIFDATVAFIDFHKRNVK